MAIGILCIGVLFAIKKFLFIHFEETSSTLYQGTQKVKLVNLVERVQIPMDKGSTLREVLEKVLTEKEEPIEIDATVLFNGVGLKVANMEDGKICRVEIIKQIS